MGKTIELMIRLKAGNENGDWFHTHCPLCQSSEQEKEDDRPFVICPSTGVFSCSQCGVWSMATRVVVRDDA